MNGNIVHAWPAVRGIGRIRLTREGHLLVLGLDNAVREYDWDGKQVRAFRNPVEEDFSHHDLVRTAGGNTLVLYRDEGKKTDYLLEFDPDGRIVWRWDSAEIVRAEFPGMIRHPGDVTHINSVQELPPNRWFDRGDDRFRPGNLLLCARNLDTVFVIDRESGGLLWRYGEGLDYPHEARMIEKNRPGAGNILIFDNGLSNRYRYRRSRILEIDPTDASIAWSYSSRYFFSSLGGVQQALANGNRLVVSSRGGRAFEIDRGGRIVWQWIPPYNPMRPRRYPYDYCPEFERLGIPSARPVRSTRETPYVDRELYRFAFREDTVFREIGGKRRRLLKRAGGCRTLLIPEGATLRVGFGFDLEAMEREGVSGGGARFTVRIRPSGREAQTLLSEVFRPGAGPVWFEETFPLPALADPAVELCLGVDDSSLVVGEGRSRFAVWEAPVIRSGRGARVQARERVEDLTAGADARLRRRLRALGYVD